jgi:hypothetical protein
MLLLALIAAIAASLARGYWMQLAEDDKDPWRRRFWSWLLQGLFFPWLIWSIGIIGLGKSFPSLVPQILDAQQANIPWFDYWLKWSFLGGMFVGFYFTAVTYVWLLGRIVERAVDKKEILGNIGIFVLLSGTVTGLLVYGSGWIYLGAGVCMALLPVVHFTIDLGQPPRTFTTYSKATGQIKRGKYQEAEWEMISQLEKRDDDFEGWLMLAELYARQYRNIEDAARVILDICNHPSTQPFQVATACHKLSDWQLEVAENPLGARAALELLCRRLPGTHFARMAQQRIRQIPKTYEEFDELKQPKRIRLPSLSENLAPAPPPAATNALSVSRRDAAAEANRLSEKLTDDPDDTPAREKLAQVLAEKLGKIDLAIEQLMLLTEISGATDEQRAKWLAQAASWEFNRTQDKEQFQRALRRIVSDFPQTTHAFAAQRRLYLLEMDFLERQYAT